jgi:hypothetical protein
LTASSRSRWITLLRAAVSAAGVLLLIVLLASEDWNQVRRLVAGIGTGRMVVALAATFASRLAVAGRWHALLRGAHASVRPRATIEITFAGLFATNFLPTTVGGDLVRLAGAFQLEVDRAVAAASLIVDRLVGMVGMALALPLALAKVLAAPGVRAWLGPGILLASAWQMPEWLDRPVSAIRSSLGRVWQAFGLWRRNPASIALAFGWTFAHMALLFGMILLLLEGMGAPSTFFAVAGAWSLVYFITLFPISLNGLGVQEVALTFVFTRLLGLPTDVVLVLAVSIRLLQMLASLPGAFFLGRLLPRVQSGDAAGAGS